MVTIERELSIREKGEYYSARSLNPDNAHVFYCDVLPLAFEQLVYNDISHFFCIMEGMIIHTIQHIELLYRASGTGDV
jgi:hypothetical protein